jgi:cytochrome c peroxidase
MRWLSTLTLGAALTVPFAPPPFAAKAEDVTIELKERELPEAISGAVGSNLRIINADDVFHSLFSDTPGHEFNLGTQLPGQEKTVPLDKAGQMRVKCWIHPSIKMDVTVTDGEMKE